MSLPDSSAPDARLQDAPDAQIGVSIPAPLSARLDGLVERAREAGDPTSRKELLAALILGAPDSGDKLSKSLRRFRLARIEEALLPGQDISAAVERRPPGPRPRRRTGPGTG